MSVCACMGPQGSDPVCPCRMKSGDIPGQQWVRIFSPEDTETQLKLIRQVIEEHRDVLERLKDR